MGSTVTDGDITGIVGDDGLVYLSGMQTDGILTAQWGSAPDQHCTIRYHLPKKEERTDSSPVIRINETCHSKSEKLT
ncbi:FimD/PapC C-terminal domain-containing protein [Tatumella ptyseos]|nr:FimD/PapC C-terminal domain-containing protein [Tatumella ptyseos]